MTAAEFDAQCAAHDALVVAQAAREATKAADTEASLQVRAAVLQAFATGVPPKHIIRAAGLSKTRIYQIRDGE